MSKIKMFVHGISSNYLFELLDKYFEMSYPMNISITNICIMDILGISSFHSATGRCRLESLAAPSDQGCRGGDWLSVLDSDVATLTSVHEWGSLCRNLRAIQGLWMTETDWTGRALAADRCFLLSNP